MRKFPTIIGLALWFLLHPGVLFAADRPVIQKLSHDKRPGGKAVAFYGKGFGSEQGSAAIGLAQLHVYGWSENKVEVLLPESLPAGQYDLELRRIDGAAARKKVTLLPRIAKFEVDGTVRPYQITIRGNSFGNKGRVRVAGETVTVLSWSPKQIEVLIPEHIAADWHDVFLETGGTRVLAGQFGLPPELSAIDVTTGTAGTTLTLRGLNLGPASEKSMVVFGDWHNAVSAPVVAWSPYAVTATVSYAVRPGRQPVWLWIDGVPSRRFEFSVVPQITRMLVGEDESGDAFLVIRGANFGSMQVDGRVEVDGLPSVIASWRNHEVIVQIPKTVQPGDREVVVSVNKTVSNPAIFRIAPPDDTIYDGVWRGRYEKPEFDESW